MSLSAQVSPFKGWPESESYSTPTGDEQEHDTEHELADPTWQFPSLEVARMLSPKTPKAGVAAPGGLFSLDQYDCVAYGPLFQDTVNDHSAYTIHPRPIH